MPALKPDALAFVSGLVSITTAAAAATRKRLSKKLRPLVRLLNLLNTSRLLSPVVSWEDTLVKHLFIK